MLTPRATVRVLAAVSLVLAVISAGLAAAWSHEHRRATCLQDWVDADLSSATPDCGR